jgi:hypothetical protein
MDQSCAQDVPHFVAIKYGYEYEEELVDVDYEDRVTAPMLGWVFQ